VHLRRATGRSRGCPQVARSFLHDLGRRRQGDLMAEDEIAWGRRPGTGWTTVTPGAHVRTDLAGDLAHRLMAWQLVLPFWASFTGLTVAMLRGWWVPPLPDGLPVFVASGRSDRIDRVGLAVCRHDVLPTWELVDGVRVTSSAEALLACARDLALLDVVLLVDASPHVGDVSLGERRVVARQRRRGSPLLRRAIPLMDGRAESIYEGLLRMLHVACGVAVEPQYVVRGPHGDVTARADLRILGTRRLPEYDGEDHLRRARQRQDLRRAGRISDAGFERRGYTKEDVLFAGSTILRDADRALGRPHEAARIAAWHELLRASLFSASGRYRLMRRLALGEESAERMGG